MPSSFSGADSSRTSSGPQLVTHGALLDVAANTANSLANTALSSAKTYADAVGAAAISNAHNYADSAVATGTAGAVTGTSGTFTPGLAFGGASTGITYVTQTGSYVKHGNVIFWQFHIELSSNGSAVGAATITGMPFTGVNDSGVGSILLASGLASLTSAVVLSPNGTSLNMRDTGAASVATLTQVNFTNAAEIYAAGSHRTTT